MDKITKIIKKYNYYLNSMQKENSFFTYIEPKKIYEVLKEP